MTPAATTPAARGKKSSGATRTKKPAGSAGPARTPANARSTGHARTARPASAPRRVSGPAGGRGATRSPGTAAPRTRPAAPRRRSGATARTRRPLRARAIGFVRGLPDHSLLDQIVRGRAWIPLLGVLLVGIVAMQVEVLKLSASMGRSLERGTALQSRNEQLRASVAELSDDQRIETIATQMGMAMAGPTSVHFLASTPAGQMGRALGNIHAPNSTAFLAGLAAENAAAAASTTSIANSTATNTTAAPGTVASATPATAATTPVTPAATTPAAPVTPTTSAPSTVTPAAASPSVGTPVGGATPTATSAPTGG